MGARLIWTKMEVSVVSGCRTGLTLFLLSFDVRSVCVHCDDSRSTGALQWASAGMDAIGSSISPNGIRGNRL